MNIFVPYLWLKEHLDTEISPEEMQRIVSLSGPSIERIEEKSGDKVFDIEVTTNRMDSASIRGVAREAAVILETASKKASLKPLKTYKAENVITNATEFPIKITNDPNLCPRVTCVLLSVKIKQSPEWLKTRLEQVGIRSLNNVIDITNYVMSEIGQPTHAFDADRLGNTMMIRASQKGEKLITLDGKTHTLAGGDIVIDNGKGELTDLIGIMGTANSVVQDNTTRVLFFIEHADSVRIRKTSMGLAIRTNAAQLNEKMLDPNLVMEAMLRGIALFQEVAEAKVESPILDLYAEPVKPGTIMLPLELVRNYLGIELASEKQQDILEGLGCTVIQNGKTFEVTIPTFRPDLEIPVDLVEEIARIYGYHNLPSTLMDTRLPTAYPQDTNFSLENDVKHFLADLGWQEVYTYSAVSKELAEQSGKSLETHLKLQNPLNDEHVYLRQSLVPSLEEVIVKNKQLPSLSVFELANVYIPREKDLPDEQLRLSLVSTQPFRVVKGQVEALLAHLFIAERAIEFKQNGDRHAEILIHGEQVGAIVHVSNDHTAAGFLWKSLLKHARRHPTYESISQFSPIIEDMTFTLPEKTQVGEVVKTMYSANPLIQHVEVKDVYKQNVTFTITYLDREKQISTEHVGPLRKTLIETLKQQFNASFVGAL